MSVLLFMPESGGNPLESVILTSVDGDFCHPLNQNPTEAGGMPTSKAATATTRTTTRTATTRTATTTTPNGKSTRTFSVDSRSVDFSIPSAHGKEEKEFQDHQDYNGNDRDDDDADAVSSLGEDASKEGVSTTSSSSSTPRRRRPPPTPSHTSTSIIRSKSAGAVPSGPTSWSSPSTRFTSSAAAVPALHPSIVDAHQPQLRLTPWGAMVGASVPGGAKQVVRAVNKAHERRTIARTRSRDSTVDDATTKVDSMRVHCGFYV